MSSIKQFFSSIHDSRFRSSERFLMTSLGPLCTTIKSILLISQFVFRFQKPDSLIFLPQRLPLSKSISSKPLPLVINLKSIQFKLHK